MTPDRGLDPLFAALVDDAAIFPPGDAALPDAVAAHRALTGVPRALTGAFVCPATRLDELAAVLARRPATEGPAEGSLRLALTVPGGVAALPAALAAAARRPAARLVGVELPVDGPGPDAVDRALTAVAAVPVPVHLEIPASPRRAEAIARLAGTGVRAKIRTGGTVASAFPDGPALAAALLATVAHRVPFKLTAGLHHAVRHDDPATGFAHHGFLNVLVAVDAALRGGGLPELVAVLADRDGAALADAARGVDPAAVRGAFLSFGSCSIADPVADLVALGLLPTEVPV